MRAVAGALLASVAAGLLLGRLIKRETDAWCRLKEDDGPAGYGRP